METSKVVLGVLAGVAVGALFGVLFAPDKGFQTRKKIVDTGKDYANGLKEKFENLYQEVVNKNEDILKDANEMVASNNEY
ncbi:YtxH domain-containing protein [Flavobacterium sp.]|uniref:YtxH domain-containing protein n=1 Tax=Flavobacterium sp. TaxID=239 RepID=UPI00375204DD